MEVELTGKISSLESQIETLKKARDHDKTTSRQKIVSILQKIIGNQENITLA